MDRHDDLKQMLDSNKDSLKLEAMKRIIGMVAKGKDATDLFPAVVKNVVSKNIEVKKLVYVYLVRYAEEQQDLALLSISTFQRALKVSHFLVCVYLTFNPPTFFFSLQGSQSTDKGKCITCLVECSCNDDCADCDARYPRICFRYVTVCEKDSSTRNTQVVSFGCRAKGWAYYRDREIIGGSHYIGRGIGSDGLRWSVSRTNWSNT